MCSFSGIDLRLLGGLLIGALLLSACGGSNRASVGGYTDSELNDRRVFLLMPDQGEYRLTDPEAFAWSRGIAEAGVDGRVYSEFRTNLAGELDERYDSNTVHNFAAQSVGATHPLSAENDFDGESSTWDWTKIEGAMKAGAIDYLIVLSDVVIENRNPGRARERGEETVRLVVTLVDLPNRRMLLRRNVEMSVDDPRLPSDTYVILARAIARELPFYNSDY